MHSGIDEVTFSIDGATQESYEQYRQRGSSTSRFATCGRWPTRSAPRAATCRSSTGATSSSSGTTATRRWTLARRLAGEIGVDRLCWELTDHPEEAYSRRFVPGAPALDVIRHEIWDHNNLGNAIPGATPRARIDVRTLVPGLPLLARRRTPAANPDARAQPLDARVSRAGDVTAAASSALARSCARRRHAASTAISPAASCATRCRRGASADIVVTLPPFLPRESTP